MSDNTKSPAMNTASPTDEQAYEASGYRHFMDLPTFKAFRADAAASIAARGEQPQGSATSGEAAGNDLNILESCALWLAGRSGTVWGRDFGHADLMEQYARRLREIRAALVAKAEQSNTPGPRVGGNTWLQMAREFAVVSSYGDNPFGDRFAFTSEALVRYVSVLATPVAERAAAPALYWKGREITSQQVLIEVVKDECSKAFDAGAAPEVAQPAAQGESIEVDPEFRKLAWRYREANGQNANAMLAVLIDCINAWGKSLATPAPTAGEASGQKGGAW